MGSTFVWLAAYVFISNSNCATGSTSVGAALTDANPLATPVVGDFGLRVLSPTTLELTLITTKDSASGRVSNWDFVSDTFALTMPAASSFSVTVNSQPVAIASLGFKRRPIYAPVKERDLRVGSHIYIKLASPIADGATVEVKNPGGNLWTAPTQFVTTTEALRFNPAIHVNEVGYMPTAPKKAMVGYYLGNLGEMDIPTANGFKIVSAANGAVVFTGALTVRKDIGYKYLPLPYQKVYEADFSSFTTPGEYRLQVPGMGASYAFMINEGVAATFARTFALGLFHQRCGADMGIPFTRHDHGYCHTNLVEIPTMDFKFTQTKIAEKTEDYAAFQKGAPRMTSTDTSLFPFVQQGTIDVSKGHHDAGDYSKYTINSAGLIHHLVFAADCFAGAGALDNLGLPESGDGKSDLLQEAKWEADYLAKMQDTDGGFYFLVYPKAREYENDVTPDHGDPQVVWPKTTAVTAAATAALAEIASSPRFKQQFPAEAAAYMAKAQLGWTFLMNAIAKYGKDGSYQKITHYGNEFIHDDELAWAASAMFAATGNSTYLAKLKEWLPDPNSPNIRRWGWWRLYEGWGCAIRTYAFAVRSGRVADAAMDKTYLAQCNAEIIATADDITRFSKQTAYGTSFGDPYKDNQNAGWYFSSERGFDITVGYQLNPKPEYKEAVFANVNYEGGCNPANVAYVTGIGWKRQREVVQQHAQNDRAVLPPSGIPIGNIQKGFAYLSPYKGDLTQLTYPPDNVPPPDAPYPYYDRWSDSYDTMCEFVVVDEARSVASLAYWMAQSEVATQPWRSGTAQITGLPAQVAVDSLATVGLSAPGMDLSGAQIVWEVNYLEPSVGSTRTFTPKYPGASWVEAEVLLPDGRRLFAHTNFTAMTSPNAVPNAFESTPVTINSNTVAIYHLDSSLNDATTRQAPLTLSGDAALDVSNIGWMTTQGGGSLRVLDIGDQATVTFPGPSMISATTEFISVEAMIYINEFKGYNRGNAKILSLEQAWNSYFTFGENMYDGLYLRGAGSWSFLNDAALRSAFTPHAWHHFSIGLDKTGGYVAKIDGKTIASQMNGALVNWTAAAPITLQFGDFDGWVDEVVVRSSSVGAGSTSNTPPTVRVATVGSIFTAPASVTLTASPADADGWVTKVEFFSGATKLGEDTTAPFTCAWSNVGAGIYTVTARATDNQGATTTSPAINVTINSPPGTVTTAAATLLETDVATKGDWIGIYGAEGYAIAEHATKFPTYGGATLFGKDNFTWSSSTSDIRALQKVGATDRIASAWYAPGSFNIDFNFLDASTHRVSLYVMDWDNGNRSERIEVLDAVNNTVLNTTDVTNFSQGKYLVFGLKGKVRLRVTRIAGNNAIVQGIFFDAAPRGNGGSLKVKGASAQGLQIEVSGMTGEVYNIQSSSDMLAWKNVGQLNLTTSPMTFIDPTTTASQGLRFYRVAP